MKQTLLPRALAVLAVLSVVLAPVAPADASMAASTSTQDVTATGTGPITLTGLTPERNVYRPYEYLQAGWATSDTTARHIIFVYDGPGQSEYLAQWMSPNNSTGSNSGNATGNPTDDFMLPGLYRLVKVDMYATQGTATFYPDGSVARDGRVAPTEHHNLNFKTMSFRFDNPVITAAQFDVAPAPKVVGTAAEGSTLSALVEGWSPTPPVLEYQWYRDGLPIHEPDEGGDFYAADRPSYTLKSEDVGHKITLTVEGWSRGRAQTFATSAPTTPVQGRVRAGSVSITGNRIFGSTMTAVPAGWGDGVKLSYQWYRDWYPITGAISATYTATFKDVHHGVNVRVTGSKPGLQPVTVEGNGREIGLATLDTTPPSISGVARVGSPLTANHGVRTPVGEDEVSYQWLRNGQMIRGAQGRTYTPVAADRGARLSTWIHAMKRGYTEEMSIFTPATGPVDYGALKAPTVKVSGTAQVGKRLTASHGSYTPGATVSYQWLRSGKAISKATGKTYTLTASDRGKRVSVRTTGSRAGFATLTKISAVTRPVAYGALSAPSIKAKGTARVGSRLTASHAPFKPKAAVRYQWLRNGKTITRANGKTYKLTRSDRDKRVSVRITGSLSGYKPAAKTSVSLRVR
ncbi:hypothetical protein [Arthrobacter sulfonylureivorans]|uniref:Ig-like domain-containing protein n=1 Tax=Arthrobacter sulfonylureivorans TaxID=2486855 RepID=A0ABY3W9T7_9MICC|nr:hypothetical protein [Arthrobacter sulfonylureivorans]UNK47095.1 hypothetical protein MNQ99_07060 [Arthrobacter sulfonylureivorans]